MEPLVTTQWLEDHLGEPDLVLLDCSVVQLPSGPEGLRFSSGRADFDAGHIPTAGFADLVSDLSDPASPLKYALPSAERFCEAMGALGVGDDSRVVVYDGSITAWAARVWWMLRWVGFDRAAILDGGMGAWKAEGRPISTEPAAASPRELTASPRPELVATRDDVLAAIADDRVCILDAMPAAHYRGEQTMYERTGHVPGAINTPVRDLLDEAGRFRPLEQLAALHPTDRSARMITYCGGGIAAAASAFVLTRLGFDDVAVYTASMQEWAADPANPLVVDED